MSTNPPAGPTAGASTPQPGQIWQHPHEGKVTLIKPWNGRREWVVENEKGLRSLRFLELMWPFKCPITGREYWGHVTHPEHGSVPTYGGPFDTYMIPERTGEIGADDEWTVERYDQDAAEWLTEGFL